MPRRSPYQIVLSPAEERELECISRRYTAPYYEVIRAKVVLLAAEGFDESSLPIWRWLPLTPSLLLDARSRCLGPHALSDGQ